MARKGHPAEMQRRIDFRYIVSDEEPRRHSVWVNENATDSERKAAVREVLGDVRSWNDDPVELEGWGETGWVRDANDWSSEPRLEDSW